MLLGEGGSEKADVYSLGVVLWEIVTQEMPQRGRLRDPDVPRECPQAVADAIQACMQVGRGWVSQHTSCWSWGRLRDPDVPQECPQAVADAIQACMQVGQGLVSQHYSC